jgi:hypothetical protein
MARPYSIKIFLPQGDPDGLRTIEKSNWSGAGIVIPRSLMSEARSRRELQRTGVYVLMGPAEESSLPRVYIGEGDPIRPRLEMHASKKDFWTWCIAFTSKDENLNKAHVQYLESSLLSLAADAKRCVLDNGNSPALPSMSEADQADAEGFLAEALLCFPVLGVNVFAKPEKQRTVGATYFVSSKGIRASGAEVPEGFVVYAGSTAVASETNTLHDYMREIRKSLEKNGVLRRDGEVFRFTQDYVFGSPSTAAGVVQGRAANGRTDWKTKDGVTLKAIQEADSQTQ